MFTGLMGILLAGAGAWDLFYTRSLFKQLKSGKLKTTNQFMAYAVNVSLIVGIALIIGSIPCLVAGVQAIMN
ncbi:hypothetical protein [Lapidilactobacillus bayanensis]|uniref:hypothetical protein n=1 Tax=Lapidilactobacillus bayanensis TaxID=2485998 RepID=UPI000F78C5BF|nr:hypothetical protein [Lapidilactobacillus bayanensis]